MILSVGEILYDIFPEYKRLGGAPFNFIFHLKQLGLHVRFISRVGKDKDGAEVIDKLTSFGFDRNDIQIDPQHKTGAVNVTLDKKGVPTFSILTDVAYDYIETRHLSAMLCDTRIIYYGTLIQRTEHGFSALQSLLSQKKEFTKCFYDLNLRPDCYSQRVIQASLNHADILKLNDDELNIVSQMFAIKTHGNTTVKKLMEAFSIELVVLTRGDAGSELFFQDQHHRIEPEVTPSIVDTVGAGDAYAAMITFGYLRNWPPVQILTAASHFASQICEIPGAIPSDNHLYTQYDTGIV